MNPIKKFDEWVNEDFATVANTPGMGAVTPPTSSSDGSGDTWPSLGAPSTQTGSAKKKKRKKRKSRKVEESTSEVNPEETIEIFDDALLTGSARDTSIDDRAWIKYFDDIYGSYVSLWMGPQLRKELRALFAEFKYEFWLEYSFYDENENLKPIFDDGWKLFTDYKEDAGEKNMHITRIFYKPYSEQEIKDNREEVLSDLKSKIPSLHKKSIEFIESLLTPEEIHALRGKKGLSKFGI